MSHQRIGLIKSDFLNFVCHSLRRTKLLCVLIGWLLCLASTGATCPVQDQSTAKLPDGVASVRVPEVPNAIRVATFNVSLYREKAGLLAKELENPSESKQLVRLGKIIELVSPDIILINEIDSNDGGQVAKLFLDKMLNRNWLQTQEKKQYRQLFTGDSNTGVASGLDLNQNGKLEEPDDAWGYGRYPGQYGMAVYSCFPIDESSTRTFQNFLWSDLPQPNRPRNLDGSSFWPDDVWNKLRLSSKSHWDVAITIGDRTLHLLASHPTPPVFDGDEDRNGCRNCDEIRFWTEYFDGSRATHAISDQQREKGEAVGFGLAEDEAFVVLGDLNADPSDGGGIREGISSLLKHPRVNAEVTPASFGGPEASILQAEANRQHIGNSKYDTADFSDARTGNLRVDFVLPSANLKILGAGVFWPPADALRSVDSELLTASDHRLVWVDIEWSETQRGTSP